MAYIDTNLMPNRHAYTTTNFAVPLQTNQHTISKSYLDSIRAKLDTEYARRCSDEESLSGGLFAYYDYTSASEQFTDSDGNHINQGSVNAYDPWTGNNSYLPYDPRGTCYYWNGMDRFLGTWKPPEEQRTWTVEQFLTLIDGLCHIIDIDKYYGVGSTAPVGIAPHPTGHPDPQYWSRVANAYRQTQSIEDWVDILKQQPRCVVSSPARGVNHYQEIWYRTYDYPYETDWTYTAGPHEGIYEPGPNDLAEKRNSHNPTYVTFRGTTRDDNALHSSCHVACTGLCTITCFTVCMESCVYLCDDDCGYTCINYPGDHLGCGATCITDCLEFCGGRSGGNACQTVCDYHAGSTDANCSTCASSCDAYVQHKQACVEPGGQSCVHECNVWTSDGNDHGTDCMQHCKDCCFEQCGFNKDATLCLGNCYGTCKNACKGDCVPACMDDCTGPCYTGCKAHTAPPPPEPDDDDDD